MPDMCNERGTQGSMELDGLGVGAGEVVGAGVVGAGVGEQVPAAFCWTPHDVDSHGVPLNA